MNNNATKTPELINSADIQSPNTSELTCLSVIVFLYIYKLSNISKGQTTFK